MRNEIHNARLGKPQVQTDLNSLTVGVLGVFVRERICYCNSIRALESMMNKPRSIAFLVHSKHVNKKSPWAIETAITGYTTSTRY